MNIKMKTIAIFLFGAVAPALAADQDVLPLNSDEIAQYRNVGQWVVHENRTRGSCFISRSDEAGHLVQIGLTKDSDYGYVSIFQKGIELEEGTNAVAILVNDNLYVGESKAVVHGTSGGYEGGYVLAKGENRKQLRLDLEKQKEMTIFPDKPYTVKVNLDKVRNAIFEARECTKKLQGS